MRCFSCSFEMPVTAASYSPWVTSTALPSTTAKLKSFDWYAPIAGSQTVFTQRVCRRSAA